jgi:hypothetical protein
LFSILQTFCLNILDFFHSFNDKTMPERLSESDSVGEQLDENSFNNNANEIEDDEEDVCIFYNIPITSSFILLAR